MPTSPILDVVEIYQGRGASYSADGTRRQTRIFHVKTESGYTDSSVVLRAGNTDETAGGPRVPRMYEHYQAPDGSFDFSLRVDDLDAKPNRAHDLWTVTARYSTKLRRDAGAAGGLGGGGGGGGDPPPGEAALMPGFDTPYAGGSGGGPGGEAGNLSLIENPLLRPPEISFYAVRKRVVADKEVAGPREGKAVKNSAGAPFDPPLEREQISLGATITRNQAIFLAGTIRTYVGTTNANTWRSQPQRTAYMQDIAAQQTIEGQFIFWRVTYKVEFAPKNETFIRQVLDQGTFYLDASSKRATFLDDRGRPIGKGLLDGAGGKLGASADPVYLDRYIVPEEDWTGLNL